MQESIWTASPQNRADLYGWRLQASSGGGDVGAFDVYRDEQDRHVHLDGTDAELGVHLDTYHMNIEESDMVQPVATAGWL